MENIPLVGAALAANIKWKDTRYEIRAKAKKHLNHRVHRGKASIL
jgi:hypothetical protein